MAENKMKYVAELLLSLIHIYNLKKLLDANKIKKLEDMPKEKATELIGKLMEKGKQQNV